MFLKEPASLVFLYLARGYNTKINTGHNNNNSNSCTALLAAPAADVLAQNCTARKRHCTSGSGPLAAGVPLNSLLL
jgi:hypothetical protein